MNCLQPYAAIPKITCTHKTKNVNPAIVLFLDALPAWLLKELLAAQLALPTITSLVQLAAILLMINILSMKEVVLLVPQSFKDAHRVQSIMEKHSVRNVGHLAMSSLQRLAAIL